MLVKNKIKTFSAFKPDLNQNVPVQGVSIFDTEAYLACF